MTTHARRARDLLATTEPPPNVFRRDGDLWVLGFAGTTVRLPDAKGLHDIARLLATPGLDVPATHLVGLDAAADATTGSDPVLDEGARRAYRQRLAELDTDIAAADHDHDLERAALARTEKDALVDALSAAYGLGRRPRRLGDPAERARKTVTAHPRQPLPHPCPPPHPRRPPHRVHHHRHPVQLPPGRADPLATLKPATQPTHRYRRPHRPSPFTRRPLAAGIPCACGYPRGEPRRVAPARWRPNRRAPGPLRRDRP